MVSDETSAIRNVHYMKYAPRSIQDLDMGDFTVYPVDLDERGNKSPSDMLCTFDDTAQKVKEHMNKMYRNAFFRKNRANARRGGDRETRGAYRDDRDRRKDDRGDDRDRRSRDRRDDDRLDRGLDRDRDSRDKYDRKDRYDRDRDDRRGGSKDYDDKKRHG